MSARRELDEPACECGEITGERCQWDGPRRLGVVVEHMPPCLRASHEAAGNRGSWPHNGSIRIVVSPECAALLADEWTEVVS